MQRQAVPTLKQNKPVVCTGHGEKRVLKTLVFVLVASRVVVD